MPRRAARAARAAGFSIAADDCRRTTMKYAHDDAKNTLQQALKRGWILRQDFRGRKCEFTKDQFRQALADVLTDPQVEDAEVLADRVAQLIDAESLRYKEDGVEGYAYLPDELELHNGRRIAKDFALIIHVEEHMALEKQKIDNWDTRN
jgi:hypothetical protein